MAIAYLSICSYNNPDEGGIYSMDKDLCDIRCIHPESVERASHVLPGEGETTYLSQVFKTLGDPTRLRIVCALTSEELCVCDLTNLLGMTESAVSHQLRKLRDLSLVKRRREGQVLFYSLDDPHVAKILKLARDHAGHLEGNGERR